LSENNIIDGYLCGIFQMMAEFRNTLVPDERVNPDAVVLILKRHLADFDHYRDAVLLYVKKMTASLRLPWLITFEMHPLSRL
jgi:uncharacterized protein YutE (UPF0331/DUF86 family)